MGGDELVESESAEYLELDRKEGIWEMLEEKIFSLTTNENTDKENITADIHVVAVDILFGY